MFRLDSSHNCSCLGVEGFAWKEGNDSRRSDMTLSHSDSHLRLGYLKANVSAIGDHCHSLCCVSAYADFLLNLADSKSCLIPQVMFSLLNELLHFLRPSKHRLFLSVIKILLRLKKDETLNIGPNLLTFPGDSKKF